MASVGAVASLRVLPACSSGAAAAAARRPASAQAAPLLQRFDGLRACAAAARRPAAGRLTVSASAAAGGRGAARVVAAASGSATSVRIIIQGRNVEVTPAIRDYCEEKVTKAVAHFEGSVKEVDVKLSVRGGDHGTGQRAQRTELTVYTLRHGIVRVEDVEDNLYASVDLVCDKVTRKLRKLKEKAVARGTWPGRGGKAGQKHLYEVLSSQDVVDDLELDRVAKLPEEVVRSKYVAVEPMTVQEAVEQLESLGHNFFLFTEKESNQLQVVYKRKERGFGVLIPRS